MDPRRYLKNSKRIVVKVGTAIVTNEDGTMAMGRMGLIVEQLCGLVNQGKEVVLVSSGAVGLGTRRLNQQALLSTPLRQHVNPTANITTNDMRAFAAAGQAGLMLLYEIMFKNYDVSCAQVLVTDDDFLNDVSRNNFKNTVNNLLHHGVIPIINENDVVSLRSTPLRDENNMIFWDNDSLATLVGVELGVDLIILLTDVEGLFVTNPNLAQGGIKPEIIDIYREDVNITFGGKSRVGRGGMEVKVGAAVKAINKGVAAVVVASGQVPGVIQRVVSGERIGTLFVPNPPPKVQGEIADPRAFIDLAREGSRALLSLTPQERTAMLHAVATAIESNLDDIVKENLLDMAAAASIPQQQRVRLQLSREKIAVMCTGIRQIADAADPVGKVLRHTELASGLTLQQLTAPIGVLLVIFESRPDVLPQVAALSLKTCNGLLVKGGKEAQNTNRILHRIITSAVAASTSNRVPASTIGLLQSRDAATSLLQLPRGIDLVIPRGSSQLVSTIQASTRIPVLGHADGVCHVFVDKDADPIKAVEVVIDSKCDYPAACNASETLLVHKDVLPLLDQLIETLHKKGVALFAGPRLKERRPHIPSAPSFSREYGDLQMTVEIVDNLHDAVEHINRHSSSHTDAIITENPASAQYFMQQVDSACVFHNASTRFADGYRFGLGAEVGISTSRIHARGPVGMDGLLTTKWSLASANVRGDCVAPYSKGEKTFTHRSLATTASKL